MSAEVVSKDLFLHWSLSQIASEFGIARETVTRRINEANIQPSSMRRGHPVYRVRLVAEAILMPRATALNGINDPEMMAPKERSDWFKSENERLKFERDSGLSVDSDESRREMAEIAKMGLQVLETLPDILERDFNLDSKIISDVELRIDALRDQWADTVEGIA